MALRHKTRQHISDDLVADDVVLVNEEGTPVGVASRTEVHSDITPLHLAFSTYLFNARGEVLLTRRALSKKTWPGVWTNSCCGHPRPAESLGDAARRRIREELGLTVGPLVPLLPDFRYRAIDASGIVENEICPVFAGYVTDEDPEPDPREVAEWAWVPWEKFAAAITSTPHVYSPWAALQVPLLVPKDPAVSPSSVQTPDVASVCSDVDALLCAEVNALIAEWDRYSNGMGVDVLALDLPAWLGELLVGRGKRLRVSMSFWGFIAAGGVPGTAGYTNLVRAAAALEALHLFALIHDDVMDESTSRRGRPSAHVEAAAWHAGAEGVGDAQLFGQNIAVLLGDLAHTVADRIADGLPKSLRTVWYALCVELVAGQRADLTGAASGRRDLAHAEHVARLKSGRYSIERPLELGALAAGATPEVVGSLIQCGEHIGRAFALRDDFLGVWGDPELTGKPAGDDLLEAKATVLLTLARARLEGHAAYLLARLGTPDVSRDDVTQLSAAMQEAGVDEAMEQLITAEYMSAVGCLEGSALSKIGIAGIRDAARSIAWRDA
jgi:isopentenyl-diphosphate delta-isomerase type 1